MATPFVKMHGLGNDFVLFDARATGVGTALAGETVRRLADRHRGIGCDQLILVAPARSAEAAAFVRIWNADGGEVAACGNAMRCVAQLIGEPATIETAAGAIRLNPADGGATVDMGRPHFEWQRIPLAYAMDTARMPVAWDMLEEPAAVGIGNPHVVFFVEALDAVPLGRLGPEIEIDALFPERVNVNVAQVVDAGRIALRVWERGAGLTQACGTGACATAVTAMRRGLVGPRVEVEQPGGRLRIEWAPDGHVLMTGPAATSFRGEVELEAYA